MLQNISINQEIGSHDIKPLPLHLRFRCHSHRTSDHCSGRNWLALCREPTSKFGQTQPTSPLVENVSPTHSLSLSPSAPPLPPAPAVYPTSPPFPAHHSGVICRPVTSPTVVALLVLESSTYCETMMQNGSTDEREKLHRINPKEQDITHLISIQHSALLKSFLQIFDLSIGGVSAEAIPA